MPNIEVQLPAGIGEGVTFAEQPALVVAWRVARPRFLLGGVLDPAPEVSLLVMTEDGQELWVEEDQAVSFSDPVRVTFFLPFMPGDEVLVTPSREQGQVVGWTALGLCLETVVVYHVHLTGTLAGEEIKLDALFLDPWLQA